MAVSGKRTVQIVGLALNTCSNTADEIMAVITISMQAKYVN